MPNLVGTGLNQVPTNSMLGGLAYQDPEHASIKDLDLKNLSQINSEISDTASDVFVYDTRKDSDGGAWRKRTQNTSWYNETLGTATRGTRREFPAVAVLVLESGKLTIYDGDDPDLPMWMVFNQSSGATATFLATTGQPLSSISILNGDLCIGFPSANGWGVCRVNFLSDSQGWYWTSAVIYRQVFNSISERNVEGGYVAGSGISGLANARVNDIAMTVLPNAPIDDATGLPVPTIAVATNGGVSVIKDDGTVFDVIDGNGSRICYDVSFTKDHKIMHTGDLGAGSSHAANVFVTNILTADRTEYDNNSDLYRWYSAHSYYPRINGGNTFNTRVLDPIDVGGHHYAMADVGVSLIEDGTSSTFGNTNGMVAYITSDYNSGYQHGDIKGAFLSDTDTTNVTGSELVSNYNFDNGNTNWTTNLNGSSGGYIDFGPSAQYKAVFVQGTNSVWLEAYQDITTVSGQKYVVDFEIASSNTTANWRIVVAGTTVIGYPTVLGQGHHSYTFTASSTTTRVSIQQGGAAGVSGTAESLSVRIAEEDRSVNNKGLQPYGTITKSAVATGADLVSYSGFSASNYLQQPYNSDLLFGTDDFCITGWVNNTAPSNSVYEDILTFGNIGVVGYNSREPGNWLIQMNKEYGFNMYYRTNAGPEDSGWSNYSAAGNFQKYSLNGLGIWYKITIVRRGNKIFSYTNDDLLGSNDIVGSFTTSSNLSDMKLTIGYEGGSSYGPYVALYSKLALWRISRSAPSEEQVKKMYHDEKHLFEENAKATLYGSSDAVTTLAYDDSTNLLHAGTSAGRSEFQGLRRINNTTTAVTTAISASNGLIAEQ